MPAKNYVPVKMNDEMYNTINTLSSKMNISNSALIRQLISIGLEKELAKESIDFIREQIHDEIKATSFPQFERLAKLQAKIGYQSVANFYMLAYIMDSILPASTKVNFADIKRNSKAMAIAYLKLNETEFADFMQSEDIALAKLDLK